MKYEELISKMTLEEKASLLSGRDFWQTMHIPHLGIPSVFLSDGPNGIRKQAGEADHLGLNASLPATCFPTAVSLANTFNVDLVKEVGKALGEEAVELKVNMLLGPGTNIKRNPRCGRCFEYFSEDPYLAGKMAANMIKGEQENGIYACVKHFAVNNQEEKRMASDSVLDERTLREIYLEPFEIAVKEGETHGLMSSYNMINEVYANENHHLLVDILRNEWGYKGIVVTDWGGDNDRVEALKCGNQLEMPTTCGDTDKDIVNAVNSGKLDISVVDKAVDDLLTFVFDTEKVFNGRTTTRLLSEEMIEKHHLVAKKASDESIVLLKNENNVLPLKKEEKVAVIGDFAKTPRYQGAGSSIVNATKVDTFLSLSKNYEFNYVGYEQGYKRFGGKSNSLKKKAVRLALKADTVLYFMGLDEYIEAEGLDRENIEVAKNQLDLLHALKETGKKIVVIFAAGSIVNLDFDKDCDALLHIYLAGQAGVHSILDILEGKVNPSGRLSETCPMKYDDIPSSPYFNKMIQKKLIKRSVEYRESIYVGYRYYEKNNIKTRYPFGYGLSYTKFEYSNLKVNENGVTFNVKNIGEVEGKDVPQLYVGLKDSVIFRPVRELKGFKKVSLKPNEEVEVSIPFDDKTFRYFNVKTNKFEVEGGEYIIEIGKDSENIVLTSSIKKEGTTDVIPYDKEKLPSYFKGDIKNISDDEFKELLGREIPPANLVFVKKKRINVDYNTVVAELKYARGWTGRAFAGVMRFAINLLGAFNNKALKNTIIMGVINQPMRGLSRMTNGAMSYEQLDGLIMMFNGHFHKGLHKFFKAKKNKPKVKKEFRYEKPKTKKEIKKEKKEQKKLEKKGNK